MSTSFEHRVLRTWRADRHDTPPRPMDRVQMMSVPFNFDAHALFFFSDDAVSVETELHHCQTHQPHQRAARILLYATPAEVRDSSRTRVWKPPRIHRRTRGGASDDSAQEARTAECWRVRQEPRRRCVAPLASTPAHGSCVKSVVLNPMYHRSARWAQKQPTRIVAPLAFICWCQPLVQLRASSDSNEAVKSIAFLILLVVPPS